MHCAATDRSAVLVTGDQDFLPLVEALVGLGLFVQVWGDRRHTSGDLANAADWFNPVGLSFYHGITVQSERDRVPIPFGLSLDRGDSKIIREGTVGGMPAELILRERYEEWAVAIKTPRGEQCFAHRKQPLLLKFCELEYGPVEGMS